MRFELDECVLRSVRREDAGPLYGLVESNRSYLGAWMPWAAEGTLADTQGFVEAALRQERAGDGFQVAITVEEEIVGALGFHRIDIANRATSIGYWLAEAYQGRGLMTAAVRRLTTYAFSDLGLHRVEIRVAVANERSRAVCRRLGFVEEGVLRDAERFGSSYKDLVIHSMLADDWPDE